ncbi:MAG: hypothetical protein BGO31_07620 [Bacteroidetes bacterium 43-16]|nr:MAG: hypothetical protein BGO31_07620 [Bacteroidetes bacterium 43-16]
MTFRYITILTAIVAILAQGFKVFSKGSFIENIGQVTDQNLQQRSDIIAKYQTGNGLNIFLSKNGIHYQWSSEDQLYRMDVKLLKANPNPRISKDQCTGFREQYQLAGVKETAYSYNRITYHDIYPGIDWTFYFNAKGQLEHDFIVKPGAKISDIRLEYSGADNITIDRKGNLVVVTEFGSITEPAPYSYEQLSRKQIMSEYLLNGNVITFKTAIYKGSLIIDPVIDWATYLGGSEYDEIRDVKVGKDGFVYVVGSTNSTSNIATTGAHLVMFQGGNNAIGADAFLSKFDSDGNCIWSTYYGGTNIDVGLALAIDTAGDLYMAGRTNSQTGISTQGSHQQVKAGTSSGYDIFLVKFDTSGAPVWGTYYGGTGSDGTQSVALVSDSANDLYLAGNTQSPNGIATTGAFQTTRPGSEDGFIAKFDSNGILIWGTYFGTPSIDWINGIAIDNFGDMVVTGETMSTTGLSTTGTYLEIGNGGRDGFIAKFDSAGQRLWGTYFGGSGYDKLERLSIDSVNGIYAVGITESLGDIASAIAYQTTNGGSQDFCLVKLNASGNLAWSTYYGGIQNEYNPALIFKNGNLYLTGETGSPNNLTTPDGINPTYNNSYSEGVLSIFNPNGGLTWATYLGGDVTDGGRAIDILGNETVIIGGKTSSVMGASTAGAHQTVLGGIDDGWLLKIKMCNLPETPVAIEGSSIVCENSEQQYTLTTVAGANIYNWILPIGWSGTSTTDTINVTTGAVDGTIKAVAINSCGISDTISLAISVNPVPQAGISRNGNILSVSQTFSTYQWLLNGNPIPGATNPTYIITQNGAFSLQVTGDNGCIGNSNEIIVTDHVSINELDNIGIRIYPNPFREKLTITVPFEITLVIYDLTGKVICHVYVSKGENEIDMSQLKTGNYLLQAHSVDNGKVLGVMSLVKLSN